MNGKKPTDAGDPDVPDLDHLLDNQNFKFHQFFNTALDCLLVLDEKGCIIDINKSGHERLGYTKEEMLGKKIADFDSPRYAVQVEERVKKLLKYGMISIESEHVTKDGRVMPVEINATRTNIGGKQRIFSVIRDITDRKEMEENLRKREQKYRAVVDTLADGFWIIDMQGGFVEVNDVYVQQSGYSRDELLKMRVTDVEAVEKPEETAKHIENVRNVGHDRFESMHRKKNGEIWPVEIVVNYWPISHGLLFVFIIDITERKQAAEEINLMAQVFKNSIEAMIITDADNKIVKINPSFTRLTGYTSDDVVGKDPKILSAGRRDKSFYEEMWRRILAEGKWQGEIWDKRKDGTEYPKWLSIMAVYNKDNEIVNFIASFSDITDKKRAEEEIRKLAFRDPLTGLDNRHSLIAQLEHELNRAQRNNNILGIMFIDLDRFKAINDALGHHIGDDLLIQVAERMTAAIRKSDVIARLGGDEFVVILSDVKNKDEISLVADKLIETVSRYYDIEGQKVFTSPSIGISIFPEDGEYADILMQRSDMAMYYSKSEGGAQYQFFDWNMNSMTTERLIIENSLRDAIDKDQFRLHFQPILDSRNHVTGVEALIRWDHPDMGMVQPDRFIYIAEETGLIIQIGQWVFDNACKILSEWNAAGHNDIVMSMNVSAKELTQKGFSDFIFRTITKWKVAPECIAIEITESTAMASPEKILKIMQALKSKKIRLSIDDFGTGYSSLAYLSRFPIDQLKVDRSFIQELDVDASVMMITMATIALAKQLGITVVVEGVETAQKSELLFKKGCDLQQGYYFCKPLDSDQVLEFILKNKSKRGKNK